MEYGVLGVVQNVFNIEYGVLGIVITEYGLEYYTEVQDLSYLLEYVSHDPMMAKYKKLTGALIGIVEDYSLVNYMTLNVEVCLIFLLSLTIICYTSV